MLIYAFYVIHSHQVKKRVVRNLFTQTPLYPLVNALYNLIFYGQFKKSIKMFNSLIVFTGRNVPFWVVEELFLGDLVPKMLCKMQLRKKLQWFNWFYLILFYRYSQETWLERDAKKKTKKKNHMRRLKASVVTFSFGLLFPLIKQLQGSFPLLISEITPCKLAKKKCFKQEF